MHLDSSTDPTPAPPPKRLHRNPATPPHKRLHLPQPHPLNAFIGTLPIPNPRML